MEGPVETSNRQSSRGHQQPPRRGSGRPQLADQVGPVGGPSSESLSPIGGFIYAPLPWDLYIRSSPLSCALVLSLLPPNSCALLPDTSLVCVRPVAPGLASSGSPLLCARSAPRSALGSALAAFDCSTFGSACICTSSAP